MDQQIHHTRRLIPFGVTLVPLNHDNDGGINEIVLDAFDFIPVSLNDTPSRMLGTNYVQPRMTTPDVFPVCTHDGLHIFVENVNQINTDPVNEGPIVHAEATNIDDEESSTPGKSKSKKREESSTLGKCPSKKREGSPTSGQRSSKKPTWMNDYVCY